MVGSPHTIQLLCVLVKSLSEGFKLYFNRRINRAMLFFSRNSTLKFGTTCGAWCIWLNSVLSYSALFTIPFSLMTTSIRFKLGYHMCKLCVCFSCHWDRILKILKLLTEINWKRMTNVSSKISLFYTNWSIEWILNIRFHMVVSIT